MNTPSKKIKEEKINQKKTYIVMITLFFAFIVSNLPNYLGIFWTGVGSIEFRQIINFLIFPLLIIVFSKDIFRTIPDEGVKIRDTRFNNFIIFLIIIISTIACILSMKKEQNEYKCLDIAKKHFLDQEFYDLDKCLNESESILLNLKSIGKK